MLDRGFALVRDAEGEPVMQAAATTGGQSVSIHFSDGDVGAVISDDEPEPGKKSAAKKTKPAKKKPAQKTVSKPTNKSGSNPQAGQGSLF